MSHYSPQGFDLETSNRKQKRRESRQNKLPPLPCDSLNQNSPISRSILEKLELYRQSQDKLLQLHERAGKGFHQSFSNNPRFYECSLLPPQTSADDPLSPLRIHLF